MVNPDLVRAKVKGSLKLSGSVIQEGSLPIKALQLSDTNSVISMHHGIHHHAHVWQVWLNDSAQFAKLKPQNVLS